MKHRNIELKARCTNHKKIQLLLKSYNASFIGIDYQTDTYFNVKTGRLKLREGNIENSLIYYQRTNIKNPKQAKIILYKSQSPLVLKDILIRSLKILIVVNKKREIYFINNVKFHLDTVKNLGKFIEIEAIDKDGSISLKTLRLQCNNYSRLFNIKNKDLIPFSYSDLFLKALKNKK